MAFEKNPLQNGVSKNINEYSQGLETRIETTFTDHDNKLMQLLSWMGLIKDYVVETGENENGSYEKWNSGKLVQRGEREVGAQTLSTVAAPIHWKSNLELGNFPISFVGQKPNVLVDINRKSNAVWGSKVFDSETLSKIGLIDVFSTSSTMQSFSYTWEATGKWK